MRYLWIFLLLVASAAGQIISGTGTVSNGTVTAIGTAPQPLAPVINSPNPPDGQVGVSYFYQLTVTPGTGTPPLNWTITAGSLPSGISLVGASGQVLGTPINAVTNQSVTFQVSDQNGLTNTHAYTITIAPGVASVASLPIAWVNNHECDGTTTNTIAFPADGLNVHGGVAYANTQAGANQAIADANARRDLNGTGTLIKLPHNSPFTGLTSMTIVGSGSTTGQNSTNCVIIDSDTPLAANQTVCSHGVRETNRNPGCANDKPSMWIWSQTNSANAAIKDSVGAFGPAHHYLIKNGEIRDDIGGVQLGAGVSLMTIGTNTETSEAAQPNHIHIAQNYIHGYDSPDISALRGSFYSMHDSSFAYNYLEMIHAAGSGSNSGKEGQCLSTQQSARIKIVHNWIEGCSEGIFIGGAPPLIPNYNPSDFEIRGNMLTLDPGWLAISNCTLVGGKVWNLKNRIEHKDVKRSLIAGNIFTQSWCAGQDGHLMLLNVRACANTGCNGGNASIVSDVIVENNIFAHAATAIQTDAGSGGTNLVSGGGNGQALKGQSWVFRNNLIYDIGDRNRFPGTCNGGPGSPTCPSSPPYNSYTAILLQTGASGQTYTCAMSRDAAGLVATANCASPGGNVPGTGLSVGDPVSITACASGDQGFIVGTASLGPPVLTGSPSSLTFTYGNTGAPNGSASCTLDNAQGAPKNLTFDHNSAFTSEAAGAVWMVAEGLAPKAQFMVNNSFTNNLWATNGGNGGGWSSSGKAEGNATEILWDTTTLHMNCNVLTGRKSSVYQKYQASDCSNQFPGNGAGGASNVTGISCSGATPDSSCVGAVGFMNGTPYTAIQSDYHQFALRPDSVYAAGQVNQGSDGLQRGANIAQIDAAIDSTQYTCATPCGTGPFPDGSIGLTQFTANNTAACKASNDAPGCYQAFTGLLTDPANTAAITQVVDPAPSNVSTIPIDSYMYSGFNGQVWCELQPWYKHGAFGHPDIGQDLSLSTMINTKLVNMQQRSCDVAWIDWYAPNVDSGFDELATQNYAAALAANVAPGMKLNILYDQGSVKGFCPQGNTDQTACIVARMKIDFDLLNSEYFGQPYYTTFGGKPILSFFVTQSNWCGPPTCPSGTDWDSGSGVWAQMRTYTNTYNGGQGILFVRRFDNQGFAHPFTDGMYAWPPPAVYTNGSPNSQLCWEDTVGGACNPLTGVGGGVAYLNTFYGTGTGCQSAAAAGKLCIGGIWPGFDWANSGYTGGVQKVMSRLYGQVLALTAAKAQERGFSAINQLYALGVATWDDYGEATEVESGVDNGYTVTANTVSGDTLTWTLNKANATYVVPSTIDHLDVIYVSNAGGVSYAAQQLPASQTSLSNLSTLIPGGTPYTLYVSMVGRPLITNRLSNGVSFSH
jgi:hypothetical protein